MVRRPSSRAGTVGRVDDESTVTGFPGVRGRAAMPGWYPDLLDSVAQHVVVGHRRAVTAANTEVLAAYWAIGHEIDGRMQDEGWGAKVVQRLSVDLKARFPGATGYSPRNLRYMRSFAEA